MLAKRNSARGKCEPRTRARPIPVLGESPSPHNHHYRHTEATWEEERHGLQDRAGSISVPWLLSIFLLCLCCNVCVATSTSHICSAPWKTIHQVASSTCSTLIFRILVKVDACESEFEAITFQMIRARNHWQALRFVAAHRIYRKCKDKAANISNRVQYVCQPRST
jgi:hypothetical protein